MLKFQMELKPSDIKGLRKDRNLNQTDFGKLIGASLRSVQMYEKGNTKPSADIMLRLLNLMEQEPAQKMKKKKSENKNPETYMDQKDKIIKLQQFKIDTLEKDLKECREQLFFRDGKVQRHD